MESTHSILHPIVNYSTLTMNQAIEVFEMYLNVVTQKTVNKTPGI